MAIKFKGSWWPDYITIENVEFSPASILPYKPCKFVFCEDNLVLPDNIHPNDEYFWFVPAEDCVLNYNFITQEAPTAYKEIEYSQDGGNTWYSLNGQLNCLQHQITYLRSNNTKPFCSQTAGTVFEHNFYSSVAHIVGGSIEALFNNDWANATSLCICTGLFKNDTGLVACLSTFPSTIYSGAAFSSMFQGSSLMVPPKLPATTLTQACYADMFTYTHIVRAPVLPATTLASHCYSGMFTDAYYLKAIPELPATTLTTRCYASMFRSTFLKFSETQTAECPNAYRIPVSGTGFDATNALLYMFSDTSGTFKGTPSINTTYYTNATIIS